MWKKVATASPIKALLTVCLSIMLIGLFGCTTGTKSSGLTDYEAPLFLKTSRGRAKKKPAWLLGRRIRNRIWWVIKFTVQPIPVVLLLI